MMYLDTILFAIGGLLLLTASLFLIALARSKKAGQEYQRIVQEETERIDVLTTLSGGQEKRGGHTEELFAATEVSDGEHQTTDSAERNPDTPEEGVHTRDLDVSVLEGKYELIREIHESNMSRVFLARQEKLGTECVIKFIEGERPELLNEAQVLKKMNHISLPQILDVIPTRPGGAHDGKKWGTFLVERYIEGFSLKQVLQMERQLPEGQICDWGIQLAQVLNYLHTLPAPIYHCDLKPANVMVTYNNRLVLVDFGISKSENAALGGDYLTYAYAAPEQFQKLGRDNPTVQKRFGTPPPDWTEWSIDGRTDLYSVGVILYQLMAGRLPKRDTVSDIYAHASRPFADIISKCLSVRPEERFQSARELSDALEKFYSQRGSAAHRLFLRRAAVAVCACALIGGSVSGASAVYINRLENLSTVSLDPRFAVVTAQQSIEPFVERRTPNGKTAPLSDRLIRWSYSAPNVARMENGRLYGINPGRVTVFGQYRRKTIALDVEVVEPTAEMTEISLRYPDGVKTSVYAGSGERDALDGAVSECAFVSPESMSMDGGKLYVTDSGTLRVIENGVVSSIPLEPDYLTAERVRARNGEVYLLCGPWRDEETSAYGFARVRDGQAELLYSVDADWAMITDFDLSSDGVLWYVQQNMISNETALNALNPVTLENKWAMNLPEGASYLAFDAADALYISVPENGVIVRVAPGAETWDYFAGLDGDRNMIDSAVPSFFRPTAMAAYGNALYVQDFGVVRKISMDESGVTDTETLAGIPTGEPNPEVVLGDGAGTVFPISDLATFVVTEEGKLLFSSPKGSVIYQIERETDANL